MDTRSAPSRLREKETWLINQLSGTATQLVTSRLAGVDAHRYHYSMLAALDEFGPASQAALGRHVGLDRSDVAAVVAELAERGLVERAPDPADRRRNIVRITRGGLRHLAALDRLVESAQQELVEPLSAAERRQLRALLARLVDHHSRYT